MASELYNRIILFFKRVCPALFDEFVAAKLEPAAFLLYLLVQFRRGFAQGFKWWRLCPLRRLRNIRSTADFF